jgi:hypothetical protein
VEIEFWQCLLQFAPNSSVFSSAADICTDWNIQDYYLVCCSVCSLNLGSGVKAGL